MQIYLKKVREGGGAVSARIVMAAARGILLSCNRTIECGGHVDFNQEWAYSLLRQMNFVKRKVTTSKNFTRLKGFSGDVSSL